MVYGVSSTHYKYFTLKNPERVGSRKNSNRRKAAPRKNKHDWFLSSINHNSEAITRILLYLRADDYLKACHLLFSVFFVCQTRFNLLVDYCNGSNSHEKFYFLTTCCGFNRAVLMATARANIGAIKTRWIMKAPNSSYFKLESNNRSTTTRIRRQTHEKRAQQIPNDTTPTRYR